MQDISIIGIIVAVVVLVILLFMAIGYVKAPPDMAYIISGVKKKSKVVIGKASIRIPFFERLDKLNLRLIPIDVKTSNAVPTADYININVDATVNVKISNNPEKLRLAAENFLNKNTEYIAGVAREVLEGNVREIVGKMKLEEMVSDRQKFANLVKENAEPDLAAMGLDIISFNVQNFVDGNEVIENLGIDNIVKIKKAAAIARAESERDIKVAQASADKESNDAAVAAQTEIAKKQNELAIKKSELQMEADTKKAMADAAYDIQKEEQRKTIEVATANADIAKQEREIELKQKEVAVTEQSLEAEVKKKAEANKYAAQQQAEAQLYQRQKEAEARQFEAQRQAEAQKAEAEAMRYAKEQEAAGIAAVGQAEAEAIRAKALAEAEGIDKKAEAMKKYGEAAVIEETRLEDYIVRELINYDDVSYDDHADLIYELAGQAVAHFRSKQPDDAAVHNILGNHGRAIAENIHLQMAKHYEEDSAGSEVIVSQGFMPLKPCAFTAKDDVKPLHWTPDDKRTIGQYVYGGFQRCAFGFQKFHSDTERILATVLERESRRWFRPVSGQFNIYYRSGVNQPEYIPDFVVALDDITLMIETKKAKEVAEAQASETEVKAKADQAVIWCKNASDYAAKVGGKPWAYLLIPHDAVAANVTLPALRARFSVLG